MTPARLVGCVLVVDDTQTLKAGDEILAATRISSRGTAFTGRAPVDQQLIPVLREARDVSGEADIFKFLRRSTLSGVAGYHVMIQSGADGFAGVHALMAQAGVHFTVAAESLARVGRDFTDAAGSAG